MNQITSKALIFGSFMCEMEQTFFPSPGKAVIYFLTSKQEALSEMYMYIWGKEKGVADGEEHFASNC